MDLPKLGMPNNFIYESKPGSFGIHSTGILIIAPLLLREVMIIQKKGIPAIRANKTAAL
jgi:hypothetical protein